MPDPQHKLVKVDDLIIHFPGDMPDDDVAAVIKKFTSSPDYKKQTHTKSQMPSGIATEESEHKRLTGNVPTVTPDWNTVRKAVYKATEPTLPNQNTTPVNNTVKANVDAAWNAGANAANVGGNIAKRAGRVIFGAVDMPIQVLSILKNLSSSDDNVSQQAETNLLNLHPGAQIVDRLKEAVSDWRKSPSLATENALGDVLGFMLLDKAGKVLPEERIKQLNAEGVVLPPEAQPQTIEPKAGPTTIEGQFEKVEPKQFQPVEAAAKITRTQPPINASAVEQSAATKNLELTLSEDESRLWKRYKTAYPNVDLGGALQVADAIRRVDGAPKRTLTHLAEALQYGGVEGINKAIERGRNSQPDKYGRNWDKNVGERAAQVLAEHQKTKGVQPVEALARQTRTTPPKLADVKAKAAAVQAYKPDVAATTAPKQLTREQAITALRNANETGKNKGSDALDDFNYIQQGPYLQVQMPLSDLEYIHQNPDREQFYAAVPGEFPPVYGRFTTRMAKTHGEEGSTPQIAILNGNHRSSAAELRGDKSIPVIMSQADYDLFMQHKNQPKQGTQPPALKTEAPKPAAPKSETETPKAETKPAKGETKYKFGNTQADIPQDSEAGQALATARTKIDKNDLMPSTNTTDGGGLEENSHITVRYGIDGEDTAGIKAYLEKQAPFEATLGKTTAFPPSEHSDGGAPVVVNIESPELHRMENEIDAHGNFTERSFPEYKPHVTLGYVKPEAAQKYVGMSGMEGKKFTVNSVSISNKDGSIEEVPLNGTAPAATSPETVEADLKQVYKSPPASDIQLADAWRRLGDVKKELEGMPRPNDPKPTASPEGIERWKADYKAWAERAQPFLEKYKQATQQIEDLKNRGIGEIRLLPDKSRVLYLNRAGLNTLYHGMAGEARPGYTLSGVSLDPSNVKAIIGNLMIMKPPLYQELTDMMLRGMDKKGVVVSAIPRKGESLREALSTLREELNHGWQNTVADQMGNHLSPDKFAELNEVMPDGMKDHLTRNYPEITNDGSELMNRRRVREASAKMLSEAPQKLGLTEDEAAAYLFQYFNALEEAHGEKALDNLLHITALAKEIKDDYFNSTDRRNQRGKADQGDVGGFQEGRSGGAPGTHAEKGQGVPAGAAAKQVTVRDPEGWVHSFPDEASAAKFRAAAGIQ